MEVTMHKEPREGLHYGVFEVAAGWVGILASPAGIRRLNLSQESPADAIEHLTCGRDGLAAESHFPDLEGRLERYFRGEDSPLDDELDLVGTDFQMRAWEAARAIPRGETRSYGWIARSIGSPGAARAVGQAMRANPVPFIVPCHRVVGSSGAMRGYGGPDGVDMKLNLLAMERGGAFGI
jgi:methylated-DNA-[protein]-cysteine S-methyltransferase